MFPEDLVFLLTNNPSRLLLSPTVVDTQFLFNSTSRPETTPSVSSEMVSTRKYGAQPRSVTQEARIPTFPIHTLMTLVQIPLRMSDSWTPHLLYHFHQLFLRRRQTKLTSCSWIVLEQRGSGPWTTTRHTTNPSKTSPPYYLIRPSSRIVAWQLQQRTILGWIWFWWQPSLVAYNLLIQSTSIQTRRI